MTRDDAEAWVAARYGADRTARLARFLARVVEENQGQNLIAPSTVETIWQRHAIDSAQLLRFDRPGASWLDIGTGGGFPGMVLAILRDDPVVMVEPRARRAAFLEQCTAELDLNHAMVFAGKVERWTGTASIISARAVASIDGLFAAARHCAGVDTRWILPKGRTAVDDLRQARRIWRGMFHVEQSLVEPEAGIVVAERVERR